MIIAIFGLTNHHLVIYLLKTNGEPIRAERRFAPRPSTADPDNTGEVNILIRKCACLAGTPNSGIRVKAFFITTKEADKMQASIALQTLPKAENDEELVRIVDEVIAYLKSSGLNCYVGPYETVVEGDDYEQLMDMVKEAQLVAIRAGAPKVSAYIKVEYEPDGEILSIDKKVTKHHKD